MKPATVLLIAALAAVLGACGDRSEEAGAPASGPIAEAPQADPTIAAEAPRADATLTAEATRADTTTSPPVAEAPRTEPATSPPVAQAPPAPATAADSPAAAPAAAAPASQPAQAAPGTVLRAENLYSEPASTSKVTASVAKGASVAILARQGGWLRVKSGNSTGWIRLLSVRAGEGGLGGAGIGDVVGAATTKSDPTRVVAVAGLRGLNEEDLKQASFNEAELARMEALTVTPAQARSFAAQSGLAVARVPDLPKPQAAQPASTWGTD